MKKFFFTILLALFTISFSYAQDYNTGIGIRGGFANGVTIKHFVSESSAFEGIIANRWRGGLELTGLYEIHGRAFDTDRLNWYVGFGGHIGFWNTYTIIGIDGILGLEYNFEEVPINLSVDWKPAFNIIGNEIDDNLGFGGDGGALSVRYIF